MWQRVSNASKVYLKKTSKSDLFLTMVGLWWVVILLVNEDMFNDLPGIYVGIAEIAGQNVWAAIFFFSSMFNVIGMYKDFGKLRRWGLFTLSLLFALICAGYIWSDNPFHTGTGLYFSLTVLAMWRLREVKIIYAR